MLPHSFEFCIHLYFTNMEMTSIFYGVNYLLNQYNRTLGRHIIWIQFDLWSSAVKVNDDGILFINWISINLLLPIGKYLHNDVELLHTINCPLLFWHNDWMRPYKSWVTNLRHHIVITWHISTFPPSLNRGRHGQCMTYPAHERQVWHLCCKSIPQKSPYYKWTFD